MRTTRTHQRAPGRRTALALALALLGGYTATGSAGTEAGTETLATPAASPTPFAPYGPQFSRLLEELTRYRALAEGDAWTPLPSGKSLTSGDRGPRVATLRGLLMQYGDYPLEDHREPASAADEFDLRLEQAVRRFQKRHGLPESGNVDEATRTRLNVEPAQRARILAANLRRWETMPKDLGPRYILVNIPEFSLRLIENEREQYRMRVVVGTKRNKTPQMATRLTRVVFNPTWTVPPRIARESLLPKGSANLAADGYRLVNNKGKTVPFTGNNLAAVRRGSVSLQQRSGPGNALGRVKFDMPNREAIFLHDTNQKHLFGKAQRALSNGCIRLEKPLEFARMMLAEQSGGWTEDRLSQVTSGDRSSSVRIESPVPVYLVYWTAWVNDEGQLQFRPDVYGLDNPDSNRPADPETGDNQQAE